MCAYHTAYPLYLFISLHSYNYRVFADCKCYRTGARKYRDVFEAVRQAVLEAIEKGGDTPRCPIANLRPEVRAALRSVVGGFVEAKGEFSAMLDDMIGSPGSQSRDANDGSHAGQDHWSEDPPSNHNTGPGFPHATFDNGDSFPHEAATYVFNLDNMAMDDLAMDFSVPEDSKLVLEFIFTPSGHVLSNEGQEAIQKGLLLLSTPPPSPFLTLLLFPQQLLTLNGVVDMLIGGLVDVSQNEWVMRNTFTPPTR